VASSQKSSTGELGLWSNSSAGRNLGGCGKAGLVFECAAAVRRDVLFKRDSSILAALLYFDHD